MKTWIVTAASLAFVAGAGAKAQGGMDMPADSSGVEILDRTIYSAVEQHARAGHEPLSTYQGMGGPNEDDAYPPCKRGPGDDNCIQLYESAPQA